MLNRLPDDIDFVEYLEQTESRNKVRPASEYVEDVLDLMNRPATGTLGRLLPWPSTHSRVEFRPKEVTVWSGFNGDGKSLVLGQVILSLVAQGGKACIASMEMAPERTLYRMSRQASSVRNPDAEFVRLFCKYLHGKMWIYDHRGDVNSRAIAGAIRYCGEELGITHFVIDSLMKCGIREDGAGALTEQKDFMALLCQIALDTGIHIHLVAHSKKPDGAVYAVADKQHISGSAKLSDMADNVFIVQRNRRKEDVLKGIYKPVKGDDMDAIRQEPDACLAVRKQRNGEWEDSVRLWFHAESFQFLNGEYSEPMVLLGRDDE